jgi:hypothetical protein
MSILHRWAAAGTMVISIGVSTTASAGLFSPPAPPQQESSVLVDLSGANMTEHGATTGTSEVAAPIVEAASKKKKPAPSVWSRMMHPTQWFSSSKKK